MRYWEPVTEVELERIHEAACRMLDEQGLRIVDRETCGVLLDAGARKVDEHTVRIPRSLVEQAIATAPARFPVHDRRGGSMMIGAEAHYHLPGATMTEVLEHPGWRRRPATLADVRDLTRIVDSLDAVDFASVMVEGADAPRGMGEILSCAEVLKNTTKFCLGCPVTRRANRAWVEMAKVITGTEDLSKRPVIALLATMLPGYEIDAEACQVLLLAAREGVPVVLMGGPIMGMQGPATMAGGMVMQLAEELAGLCIVQAVRPSSPCLMNWGLFKLDMRTAELEGSGPEYSLGMGVGAQLSRKYGIPSYSCPSSDSKIGDFQAGMEMAETMMAAMLSGIHVTVNAGTAAKCSVASYELLILHNEMLRSMSRIRRGMVVDAERLATEMQMEVGIRGEYVVHPHTLKYVRHPGEFLHKDLLDATGMRSDYRDLFQQAQQRWKRILEEHEPGVSEADQRAIDEVVAKYSRESEQS